MRARTHAHTHIQINNIEVWQMYPVGAANALLGISIAIIFAVFFSSMSTYWKHFLCSEISLPVSGTFLSQYTLLST